MTFDVDAWLDEAQPPTRAVKVYGRGDLVARLQQLAVEDVDQAPAVRDDRLAGPAPTRVDDEAERLRAELEASALTIVVRGLLDSERFREEDSIREAHGLKPSQPISNAMNEDLELRWVNLACIDPSLSVEQAERLRRQIGQAQFQALVGAITSATLETIDVPLSRLGSGTVQAS
jgi:hypothetical protein